MCWMDFIVLYLVFGSLLSGFAYSIIGSLMSGMGVYFTHVFLISMGKNEGQKGGFASWSSE